MYPELQQAIYTRCHAPYSITGREGFGWRYLDEGTNLVVLEEMLPYASYRQEAQSAGVHTPMMIYTLLHGYRIIVHSIPVLDGLRGGNYLAQILLAKPGQFSTCDAALNMWQDDFWLKKDVYEPDWCPPSVNRLLRHPRGRATASAQNILRQAVSILEVSPAGLGAALNGLDYLIQYACQRALLIQGTEEQIKACMTVLIFSLPESLAINLSFATNIRALNRDLNPQPILRGWPLGSDEVYGESTVNHANSLSDTKLIDLLAEKNSDRQATHSVFSQTLGQYWSAGAIDPMQKRVVQLQDWCGTTNLAGQTDRCLYQGLAVADLLDEESKPVDDRLPYHKLKDKLLKHAIVLTPAELARTMRYLLRVGKLTLLLREPADTFLADYRELIRQAGHCMMRVRLLNWLIDPQLGRLYIPDSSLHQWLMKSANRPLLVSSLDCYLHKVQDKDKPVLDPAQMDADAFSTWLVDWIGNQEPARISNRWLSLGVIWYGLPKESIASDKLVDRYAAFRRVLHERKIRLNDCEVGRVILYMFRTRGDILLDNSSEPFLMDCRCLMIRKNEPSFLQCLVIWLKRWLCR